jgi:hypothetical protein
VWQSGKKQTKETVNLIFAKTISVFVCCKREREKRERESVCTNNRLHLNKKKYSKEKEKPVRYAPDLILVSGAKREL